MTGPTGAVNSANIFTGGPDQAVTGAVLSAPTGTTLPTSISGAINSAFVASGYVSDAGLKLTPNRSTKDIKDWSNTVIRKVLDSFDNELEWENLETNEASLTTYWGDTAVTVTPATNSSGTQTVVAVNSDDLPHKSWIFKIKDGPRKVMIVIPDGQVSQQNAIPFTRVDAIKWGVKLATYPDASGNHLYLYTDDGVFTVPNKGSATPGTVFPAEATVTASDSTNAAKLAGLGYVANPTSAWTTGQKITVGTFDFNWSGTAWAAGAHA